jgi:HAMP domain-containing protein
MSLKNSITAALERAIRYLENKRLVPKSLYVRIKNYSLSGKINFIILAATLPMISLLAMLFLFLYIQLKGQLDLTLIEKMVATKNAYNFYERATLVYAKMLAENPYIKKELLVEAINVGPILRVCNQVQSSVDLNRITVHDRKGIVVVRSHKTSEFGDDESKSLPVERALKKGENTAILTLDDKQLILQNTVPVYQEGETVGAITAGYILNDAFASSLANLTQAGVLFVLNGRIISSSFPGFLAAGNNNEYNEENLSWSETRRLTLGAGKTAAKQTVDMRYLPILTERLSGEVNKAGIVIAVPPPFSRALLYTIIWGSFLFSLGVVFFGIIFALKIGHNIAFYATSISSAMRGYAQGDLNQRISKHSRDELGEVALGFNTLAAELQKKISEIQEARDTLELKVIDRTRDLNEALLSITALKENQEGDYFLTDLLLRPLSGRAHDIPHIRAEFIVEQKKKYNFRGRTGDIGGDYCLMAPLSFEDHEGEWLFFFNGDAMGKSTQGASGALICGVTLHSILDRHSQRTRIVARPEQYLAKIYHELNHIFSLFDFSMLMSAACGLIHGESGTMYYFNCEHPWTVLLREGKAGFIESELSTHKLGMPQLSKKLSIRRIMLQKGDILLLGSDGRDDIQIASQIDSDEDRFRTVVEEAGGELGGIVTILDRYGDRTDDLSLMRIEIT